MLRAGVLPRNRSPYTSSPFRRFPRRFAKTYKHSGRGNFVDLVLIAIVLGLLAVVYGFVTSRQVLSSGAGNEKMQEIAGAIQEGAQAYL